MGNLRTANNPYARIGMTYALNGALASEIDSLKSYGSSSFDSLVYVRSYAYDRDGRRVAITHPTWINAGSDRTEYHVQRSDGPALEREGPARQRLRVHLRRER
jgi:hypothetical protein